jgi:hypothetical protein
MPAALVVLAQTVEHYHMESVLERAYLLPIDLCWIGVQPTSRFGRIVYHALNRSLLALEFLEFFSWSPGARKPSAIASIGPSRPRET